MIDTYSNTGSILTSTPSGKVNFIAPDNVSTDVNGFTLFRGTSAAAPNAAAVGALMLQANPNLTPAEVTAALEATATAMSGGAAKVGAGFVNADVAVAASFGDVWTQASGGNWNVAGSWSAGVPTGASFATLADNFGALLTDYVVTVDTSALAASTLTVGNAASIHVGLTVASGGMLAVGAAPPSGSEGPSRLPPAAR